MRPQPIFRKQFWHDFSIDIRRFRRDPRARKSILVRLGFFLYLIGVCTYYGNLFYSFHDPDTAIVMGLLIVLMLAIIAAVRFAQWREAQKLIAADFASVPRETTARVQRFAYGLSAITERALGEAWLKKNVVPENHEVVVRRITLEALRRHKVWEEIPPQARDWLTAPDGSWDWPRIDLVLQSSEILASLLWSLGLLSRLHPMEQMLEPLNFKHLSTRLQKPAPGIRPTWDMRLERNAANVYFLRCYTESIHRGQRTAATEELQSATENWIAEIAEEPQQDFLAGARTIGELEGDTVYRLSRSSALRLRTLDLLMRVQDGDEVWDELTELVYNGLLLSPNVEGTDLVAG